MPESVTDRCTKAHENIFMFSKARWTGAEEPLPMRAQDAAWLAALVDGEGTICFQDRTSERASQPTYSVRLSIVNTNRALLDRVTQICGEAGVGTSSPRHRNDGSTGRPVFTWQATNAKAARVIAAIRPYLIAKQQQADLALFVQALNKKHTGRGGYSVSRADQEAKVKAAAACSDLNHGRDVDLSWFRPVKPGRWMPMPYVYDADAIREDASPATVERAASGNGRAIHSDENKNRHRDGADRAAASSTYFGRDFAADVERGRNKRSVWTVATQPFAGSHFAVFPAKLVEPCILAGCPERACGVCGAPWQRVVERTANGQGIECPKDAESWEARWALRGGVNEASVAASRLHGQYHDVRSRTVGWEPSCEHQDDTGSSVVLDPFAGAGTTGMVALRHNRSFIGIELSPAYAELARDRIIGDAPLLNSHAEVAA